MKSMNIFIYMSTNKYKDISHIQKRTYNIHALATEPNSMMYPKSL